MIVPIGFLHEHIEVIFDLDVEIRELCEELNLTMVRAETPGLHPRFVQMIRELILERTNPGSPRLALGPDGPPPDDVAKDAAKQEIRNPNAEIRHKFKTREANDQTA